MQLSKKFRFLAASVLALQLAVPIGANAEEQRDYIAPSWVTQADYVALGDSLAHGMNEIGMIGLGYTDFVAQALQQDGLITSYNKGFAYSGYTTKNVLEDIQNNVEKPVIGFGYQSEKVKLRTSLKEAEIITLTAGANDLIPILEESQTTGLSAAAMLKASQGAIKNIAAILDEIKELNPNVQVYVMGYYNSFPYYSEDLQKQFKVLLTVMNSTIKTTVEKAGAIFVPTYDIVAQDVPSYLPNPENIHLSEAGYLAVANEAFLPAIKASALWDVSKAIQANMKDSKTVKISWQEAMDNVGVTNYNVYVNGKLTFTENADTTAITLDNLTENTTYTVAVKAVDAAGNESVQSPTITFATEGRTLSFTDIENHWAKDFIQKAAETGIMKGYADGTFRPEQNVTRAQAASMLVRSLGLTTKEQAPFTDIASYDDGTQSEIAAAYAYGLVKGTDGKFNPGQPVTRAQLALMINRAYEHQLKQPYAVKGKVPFSDIASYNEETKHAITMLYEQGIIIGNEGKFSPEASTKRSHAAKIFVNFNSLLK
ncbi:S-layer homology domain-containing protein [Lysinibacillus agricola]|uniref:S-layer homology domain-containing protein n=1 Tax=Lysinibacillus agricola TaxID=2590012 RepID=A0ABX7AT00_9BACI|nr:MULTISPECIES: S-layer homology domain-containing protein [Lysinibacillus]KOS62297.1 N-acetylmuramoyl-L-alanine amidase [Lysinibacillus sp. FJAT-14222]QQP12033.1 S-layer homology domain-containing protein [Lysinibacillus agricola]